MPIIFLFPRRPRWFKRWVYGYLYGARLSWWKRALVVPYVKWKGRGRIS